MTITLTISRPDPVLLPDNHAAYVLQFVASQSGANMMPDAGVFVYRTDPDSIGAGQQCVAVASLPLLTLPLNSPTNGSNYFRMNTGVFVCQSMEEAQKLREDVALQINKLTADWNALQNLTVQEVVTLTGEPGAGVVAVPPVSGDINSMVRTQFNADRSRLECYDTYGNLVAEIVLSLPT